MVVWVDSVWNWLSLASEVNRLVACPFHCSPSCAPWFLLGACFGLLLGLILCAVVACLWIFRADLIPRHPGFAPGVVPRPRLSRYLE